jgi:hypothetical protein
LEANNPACDDLPEVAEREFGDSEFWYCKYDGSIGNGFETVSHPATLGYWGTVDLHEFDRMRADGFRSYNTTLCGMHIHVSRNSVSVLTTYKLLKFFADNADYIARVSRRNAGALNEWAGIEPGNANLPNKAKGARNNFERRCAINLTNRNTIEFRIFRGTLFPVAIKRNIAWTFAIIRFCELHGIQELSANTFARWIASYHARIELGDAVYCLRNWSV